MFVDPGKSAKDPTLRTGCGAPNKGRQIQLGYRAALSSGQFMHVAAGETWSGTICEDGKSGVSAR